MRETSVLCYVINIHARVAVPMPMGAGFGTGAPVLTHTCTRVVPTLGTRMGTPVPVLLPNGRLLMLIHMHPVSEPVPPTNSDMSGDKCEGLSTTGGGDVEEFEDLASAYVLHPCNTCVLLFQRT